MQLGSVHRNGTCLLPRVWRARSWLQRARGLLLRTPLQLDLAEGLLIERCGSVHTFGMRYPLDLVFLDAQGRVLGIRENVRPWRACAQRGATRTLELHAGSLKQRPIALGDVLVWQ